MWHAYSMVHVSVGAPGTTVKLCSMSFTCTFINRKASITHNTSTCPKQFMPFYHIIVSLQAVHVIHEKVSVPIYIIINRLHTINVHDVMWHKYNIGNIIILCVLCTYII